MTLRINGTTVINTDRSITLGTATPGAPVTGMMRYNSTLPEFQVYDGAAWVPFKKVVGGSSTSLYSWGQNGYGVLGNNEPITSSPISVVGGFNDWKEISSGVGHLLSLRANGTLYAWGRNVNGELGDNSTVSRSSPTLVVGGIVNWISASAGSRHSLGIRADGTMWAWGANNAGQLGINQAFDPGTERSSPVAIVGGITDWVQSASGQYQSHGLRANGTLYGWGYNGSGNLGDNTTANKSSPVATVGGFTDWVKISTNQNHALAIRANGTLYAWGYNSNGQLGINLSGPRSSPTLVAGGIVNWISVGVGGRGYHSLGVRANGTMMAWGSNSYGQLGTNAGAAASRSSPVSVVGGILDWVQASAGTYHSLGIRANGTLYAWGSNDGGQLGNNGSYGVSRSSPVAVVGGFTDWIQVDGGQRHNVGLRA